MCGAGELTRMLDQVALEPVALPPGWPAIQPIHTPILSPQRRTRYQDIQAHLGDQHLPPKLQVRSPIIRAPFGGRRRHLSQLRVTRVMTHIAE